MRVLPLIIGLLATAFARPHSGERYGGSVKWKHAVYGSRDGPPKGYDGLVKPVDYEYKANEVVLSKGYHEPMKRDIKFIVHDYKPKEGVFHKGHGASMKHDMNVIVHDFKPKEGVFSKGHGASMKHDMNVIVHDFKPKEGVFHKGHGASMKHDMNVIVHDFKPKKIVFRKGHGASMKHDMNVIVHDFKPKKKAFSKGYGASMKHSMNVIVHDYKGKKKEVPKKYITRLLRPVDNAYKTKIGLPNVPTKMLIHKKQMKVFKGGPELKHMGPIKKMMHDMTGMMKMMKKMMNHAKSKSPMMCPMVARMAKHQKNMIPAFGESKVTYVFMSFYPKRSSYGSNYGPALPMLGLPLKHGEAALKYGPAHGYALKHEGYKPQHDYGSELLKYEPHDYGHHPTVQHHKHGHGRPVFLRRHKHGFPAFNIEEHKYGPQMVMRKPEAPMYRKERGHGIPSVKNPAHRGPFHGRPI